MMPGVGKQVYQNDDYRTFANNAIRFVANGPKLPLGRLSAQDQTPLGDPVKNHRGRFPAVNWHIEKGATPLSQSA